MNNQRETHKIVIVEPQTLFREGLRCLLSSNPKMKIVGEAGNGSEGWRLGYRLKPDLILTEFNLPRMDGMDVIRAIKRESPAIKVLVLTMLKTESVVLESFRAGADGYILKNCSGDELIKAIKRGKDGNWKVKASLPPGRYEYKFFVDNRWVEDFPGTELVLNQFGTQNCVLRVE